MTIFTGATSLVGAQDGLDHTKTQIPVASDYKGALSKRIVDPVPQKSIISYKKSLRLMAYTQEAMYASSSSCPDPLSEPSLLQSLITIV